MSIKKQIEAWMQKRSIITSLNPCRFSFFLPNGSYGRPFEGGWYVTNIIESNEKLEIFIGQSMKLSLTIHGSVQLHEEDSIEFDCIFLIFSGFNKLELHDYKGLTVFEGGEVKFASDKTLKERGLE